MHETIRLALKSIPKYPKLPKSLETHKLLSYIENQSSVSKLEIQLNINFGCTRNF